jgi:hypothetical protein
LEVMRKIQLAWDYCKAACQSSHRLMNMS